MTEFADARVLITGAASGLGQLLASKTADLGARVILWDLDGPALARAERGLLERGREASAYRCDLRDASAIEGTAEQVLQDHGRVDVLINNAGVVSGKVFAEMTDEDIQRTLDVNLLAPMRVTRAFLPSMVGRDRGHIVNISSAAGIVGSARLADYAASKFGLFGFDEALRIELRSNASSVRTTIVCPYYTDTGMFDGVRTRFNWLLPILDPDDVSDRIVGAVLRNRRRVVMPWFVYSGWPLRLLPVSWLDWLIDVFGISHSMDTFVGRDSSEDPKAGSG